MSQISLTISAGLAIVIGLLVLIFPKLLRWAIGFYLIIWGLFQILGSYI